MVVGLAAAHVGHLSQPTEPRSGPAAGEAFEAAIREQHEPVRALTAAALGAGAGPAVAGAAQVVGLGNLVDFRGAHAFILSSSFYPLPYPIIFFMYIRYIHMK